MSKSREAAWTDYWTGLGQQGVGGCLPKAVGAIDHILADIWRNAARELRRGARVLDLATGDGTVLRTMQKIRPDLKLVGIDSATTLPPAPKGISLRSGVAMESLPFSDGYVDLATSQFGFEYGDTRQISTELSRVIAPGGQMRLILHHSASPILRHNVERRQALAWAAIESELLPKARSLVAARERIALPTPAFFQHALAEGRRRFPEQGVAEEFAKAVYHTLELGRRGSPRETLQALAILEGKAVNELSRIDALCEAASSAERIHIITEDLRQRRFLVEKAEAVIGPDHCPLAWRLSATKA